MKIIRLLTLLAVILLKTTNIVDAQKIDTNVPTDYLKLTPNEVNDKRKTAIAEILKENVEIEDTKNQKTGIPTDILVFDDRIEFKIKNKNKILYYYELLDKTIHTEQPKIKFYLVVPNFKIYSRSLGRRHTDGIYALMGYLTSFQNQLKIKQYDYQLTLFNPVAEKYRALKIKPQVSEEQRKYIVQANSFNEKKDYDNAIELYIKAIELDQLAYPAAYSNLALLSAQVKKFDAATYYMKKYLLLEPNASDARSAQDKIYEWEILMQN